MKYPILPKYIYHCILRELLPKRREEIVAKSCTYYLQKENEIKKEKYKREFKWFISLSQVSWLFKEIIGVLVVIRIRDIDDFINNRLNNKFNLTSRGIRSIDLVNNIKYTDNKENKELLGPIEEIRGNVNDISNIITNFESRPTCISIKFEMLDKNKEYLKKISKIMNSIETVEQLNIDLALNNINVNILKYIFSNENHKNTLKAFRFKEISEYNISNQIVVEQTDKFFNLLSDYKELEELSFIFYDKSSKNLNPHLLERNLPNFFASLIKFIENSKNQMKYIYIDGYLTKSIVKLYLTTNKIKKLGGKLHHFLITEPIQRYFKKLTIIVCDAPGYWLEDEEDYQFLYETCIDQSHIFLGYKGSNINDLYESFNLVEEITFKSYWKMAIHHLPTFTQIIQRNRNSKVMKFKMSERNQKLEDQFLFEINKINKNNNLEIYAE